MSKRMIVVYVLTVSLLLVAVPLSFAQQVNWRPDITSAMAEANKDGKIVMVDVFTDWCGWCTKLDEETYSDPGVSALLANVVTLKINPEKGGSGAKYIESYKITGYPNILFLDRSGKLLDRIDGYMDAAKFSQKLISIYQNNGVAIASPPKPNTVVGMATPNLPYDLMRKPPTASAIQDDLRDFAFDPFSKANLDEARAMLRYLGAQSLSFDRPDLGCVSALFFGGVEITVWAGTYGKQAVYGLRFGVPDAQRSYFGSNSSYFEMDKAATTKIAWLGDLDAAFAQARNQGKVIMVDVFTDWCGWCTKLDEETYSDQKVIGLSKSFVSLKLDGDKNPKAGDFKRKYKVTGFPTILFLEPDGTVVNRIGGYVNADAFAKKMLTTSDYRDKVKAYTTEFNAGNYRNSETLLSMLCELGRSEEAMPIYDKASGASALSKSGRTDYALTIASSLIDSDDYKHALTYIGIVERLGPAEQAVYKAYFYHSIVMFYNDGKVAAISYLDGHLASSSTPEEWKANYRSIRDQMSKAK